MTPRRSTPRWRKCEWRLASWGPPGGRRSPLGSVVRRWEGQGDGARTLGGARAAVGQPPAAARTDAVCCCCCCRMGTGGETSEYFTDWNETYESFDQMGLHESLLRGIYAYGASCGAGLGVQRGWRWRLLALAGSRRGHIYLSGSLAAQLDVGMARWRWRAGSAWCSCRRRRCRPLDVNPLSVLQVSRSPLRSSRRASCPLARAWM